MYIHEASIIFEQNPKSAVTRKQWLVKAEITKHIMLGRDRSCFVELHNVDGVVVATPWTPTLEDLLADDWYMLRPILRKDKKVGWSCSGLLRASD